MTLPPGQPAPTTPRRDRPTPPAVGAAMVAKAGHRLATYRDAAAIVRLAIAAQRRHPGGLFGHASRYLSRPLTTTLVALGILQSLLAGDLVYDPRSRAAIAFAAAAGVGAAPVLVAVLITAHALPSPLPTAIPIAVAAGSALGLVPPIRAMRQRRRALDDLAQHHPTVYAGSYIAALGASGRLLRDLIAACDRHHVAVALETTGPARVRHFGAAGFVVTHVVIPLRTQ